MRLTDRLQLNRTGVAVGGLRPCYMGHKGGALASPNQTGPTPYRYTETAAALVELHKDEHDGPLVRELTGNPSNYSVTHHGIDYAVTGVQPRYRPGGRLHHLTLELERTEG